MSDRHERVEDLLRRLAPEVLGALVRRYGHFDLAEDAVQEALIAAGRQWPSDGVPESPRGWLITVGSRRLIDGLRSEQARRGREEAASEWSFSQPLAHTAPEGSDPKADDTLILLFMCCHPALSPGAQIALTLRAVGGLTTAETARAFLIPEDTMMRRISRAKQAIERSRIPFRVPTPDERPQRLRAVLHTLYLTFNEGYVATSGTELLRAALSSEAVRLARMLRGLLPHDPEVAALLALMLLTDARRPARMAADGAPIPMAEQNRALWDTDMIAEGLSLIGDATTRGVLGPYEIQAAVAAVHDQAADFASTDWARILALYELLLRLEDNPIVRLNRAVALAMVHGPQAALEEFATLEEDRRMAGDHRLHAVRAHLLEMAGEDARARDSYLQAADLAGTLPQQRYLRAKAADIPGTKETRTK